MALRVIEAGGKLRLDKNLAGYNHAARHHLWFVLRDLDHDAPCAGEVCQQLLPKPQTGMMLRLAVRAVESWLLADTEAIAHWLGIASSKVPAAPDQLEHPKRELVNLARRSPSSNLRQDLVPRPEARSLVGPGYVSQIRAYVENSWRPEEAAGRSPSLSRCLGALERWRP